MFFECFQGWQFHDLSGQPIPVLGHSPGKNATFQLVHTGLMLGVVLPQVQNLVELCEVPVCPFLYPGWQPDPLGHQPLLPVLYHQQTEGRLSPIPQVNHEDLEQHWAQNWPLGYTVKSFPVILQSVLLLLSVCHLGASSLMLLPGLHEWL